VFTVNDTADKLYYNIRKISQLQKIKVSHEALENRTVYEHRKSQCHTSNKPKVCAYKTVAIRIFIFSPFFSNPVYPIHNNLF
jgi:hypothetical protein